ncbi:MAG: hypothetical protein H7144_03645 [Burkholderiales bacterium]|nr:hypothetical protein [Phycisphaerae bacterium]
MMLVAAGGCDPNKQTRQPYYGPTLPLAEVIAQINERNVRIDSLRCAGTFSANLIDPKTREKTSLDGDLTLLYQPRRNLRMVGKFLANTVFEIGSNADRYWLILPQGANPAMYWGNHRLTDSRVGGLLPVRPDLLAEVLAVAAVDGDLLKEPCPVVRFNNDQDCYMITWQILLPDRWAVQKEVWYDRATLQPRSVLLFDDNGRIVLRAYLLKPQPVGGFEPEAKIASEYQMYFPQSGSTFVMRLNDLARSQNGVPRANTFNFPGDRAGVPKVIQVDE